MASDVLPYVVQPSFNWARNDGDWSTFQVNVGTPRQSFEILPSTSGSDMWIPISVACSPYPEFTNCASSRGILASEGSESQGFLSNSSSTWDQIGIYSLSLETVLFGTEDSGLYGFDRVSLGATQSAANISGQTVAAIATNDFWIGSLGLGVQPSRFDVELQNTSTLLVSMAAANLTPSQSYGFSAGASYYSAAGGLVVGGYDLDPFTPSNISFSVNFSLSRSLTASLRGIVVANAPSGTLSLTTGALNMSLDPTVLQLWLPESVCESFAVNLGLTFDPAMGLYLINETARNRLPTASPQFSFTIAANASTQDTTNIVLPCAAFDQEISLLTYDNSTTYFPIRRAANKSQFVLGRTFMQEAYIVVDWQRQNFTIGQSLHRNGVSNNIMPILPFEDDTGESKALRAGVIAGTTIGATAVGLLLGLGAYFWRRKRRAAVSPIEEVFVDEKTEPDVLEDVAEFPSPPPPPKFEAMSQERYELHEEQLKHQLMWNVVYELPGERPEIDSRPIQGPTRDE